MYVIRAPGAVRAIFSPLSVFTFLRIHYSHFLLLMSRRSPSPNSYKRYRNSDDESRYRSRRGDPGGHRRSPDQESRDGPRDRRGASERDTRRAYYDVGRRRDDSDDRRRRREGYDSQDEGRQRRDDGGRDDRRRYDRDADNDRHKSGREYHDSRGDPRRDDLDRDRNRGDDHGDERRGGSARRSASPRRSRPHSRSRSRSASAAAAPEDKAKPNFAPSGLLAAATNTVKNADGTSTLLKYNEPPEARKPLIGWRLYVFKGGEQVGACLLSFTTTSLTHPRDARAILFA